MASSGTHEPWPGPPQSVLDLQGPSEGAEVGVVGTIFVIYVVMAYVAMAYVVMAYVVMTKAPARAPRSASSALFL